MSVRSKFEAAGGGGYESTVSRLQTGASRLRAERARKMQEAANQHGDARVTSRPQGDVVHNRKASAARLEAWPLPGLAPMTRVRTSFGDVHAAALRKGDEVLSRSGAFMPILWLTRIRLDEHMLAEKPDCNPVVLAPGALAPQIPSQEVMVSPRQVICADNKSGMKRAQEAAGLIDRPGVRRLRETSLSYTMFHVGEAAEIYCEGTYLLFPMDA